MQPSLGRPAPLPSSDMSPVGVSRFLKPFAGIRSFQPSPRSPEPSHVIKSHPSFCKQGLFQPVQRPEGSNDPVMWHLGPHSPCWEVQRAYPPRNVYRLAGPSDPVSPAGKLSQRAAQFGICLSLLLSAGHGAGGSKAQAIPHRVHHGELPLRPVNVC